MSTAKACPFCGMRMSHLIADTDVELEALKLALSMILLATLSHAACPAWRAEMARDVAREHRFTAAQTALLVATVRQENGREYAGLECGIGAGNPRHPARRLAAYPEASCRLQLEWAAGTIARRYRGDLRAYAVRYAGRKDAAQWVHNVSRIIKRKGKA